MTRVKISVVIKVVALVFYFLLAFFLARAQVVSDFSGGDNDGWNSYNANASSSTAATYNAAGYITDGGTPSGPVILYAEAPAKFRGNRSLSYNQNLTFDLKTDFPGTDNASGDVVITGPGGALYYQLPTKPGTSFTSYIVKLNETFSGWHFNGTASAAPTQTQMKDVLSNITSFRIRTKYTTANTSTATGSLDNVVLNQQSIPTPPIITSISPTSGLAGTSVTITGSNFNSTLAQNIVYFNGVKASVISASATTVTVKSPSKISYGPISIINLANGTQEVSNQNFNPLFDNNQDFGGSIIPSSFSKKTDFGTAAEAGMSVGDLDGDGWTDVLTAGNGLKASVYLNLKQTGAVSSASFAAPLVLSIPSSAANGAIKRVGQTAIVDIDSDGKLDLIINVGYGGANWNNGMVVFLNLSTPGTLSFSAGTVVEFNTVNNNNGGMTIADIDGDGRPEFLGTLNNSACHLGIAQNLSTPGNVDFAAVQDFALGATMGNFISVGDLSGDGKPEIVVEAYLGGALSVYENQSVSGTLTLAAPFSVSTLVTSNVQIADLDNDGKQDLFFSSGNILHLFKNNHVAGALVSTDFSADIPVTRNISGAGNLAFVGSSDVNGDNKLDIISNDGTNVFIYQNNNSGSLSASSFLPGVGYEGAEFSNNFVLCADIDGDNKPEILVRPQSVANFRVYHNESFPAPRIDNITPSAGLIGSSVSLGGDHFSTGIGFPPVFGRLGAIASLIVPSSNTSATATVLPSSISGRFSFTEHGLTGYSKPFNVLFGLSQPFSSSSFGSNVDLALTGTVRDVIGVADFDDDGKADLAVIDNGFTGKIYKNTHATPGQPITTSSFTLQGTTYSSGSSFVVLDIDGDGKTDLMTPGSLFQNTSSGSISFTSVTSSASGFVSTPADFNKDGKTDLLLTSGGATIQVYENLSRNGSFTPSGTFQNFGGSAINLTGPSNSYGAVAADFDGDGYEDIISVNLGAANNSTYYLNNKIDGRLSSASFSSLGNFSLSGTDPYDITANDFDGDGKIDIAITYFNSAFVSVLLNNSSGVGNISFTGTDVPVVNKGYKIAAQDLDGDGKAEIVVIHQPNPGPGSYTVLQNKSTTGSVNFVATNITLPRNPQAINFADINGDKKPDILIVGSSPTSALMVFENKTVTPVLSITTQPTSVYSVCNGATPAISTVASGTTNITYQWQYSSDGVASYADLTNTGGYSNVSTSSFTINSTGNFGAGFYRCKINGDFAATIYSNTVSFSVNPIPSTPVTSNVNNCGPGSLVLSASGTSNGNYLWYDQNGFIAGQNNSTYTTPVISSTSFYSVAITDGICVSPKVNITATINTVPAAPTTSDVNNCGATSFTLTAPGGSNGNYLWYDINGLIGGQVNSTYVTPVITSTTAYSVAITDGTCISPKVNITAAINTVPTIPATSNVSNCGATNFTLTASGGSNGNYLWYDINGLISGQVNSNYVTPIISALTTYSVAITNGLCVSPKVNITATINTVPAAPTTSDVNNCGATSFTLTAPGGSDGNYLWYDINGLIGGQVNSTYVTPVITSTTAYSVAITNGSCNSVKANITATINIVPIAPTTQDANQCSGSTFLLTASGGTDGQYVWYTTSSGGSDISGEVNSTYVTPALTANSTYYVSINNGICESARTPVIATVITSGCSIPVITSAPLATQVGGSVTLSLLSLITTIKNNLDINSIVVTQQPPSGAKASITNGVLTVNYAGITFSGSEQITIQACDTDGNCATQVFTINVAGDIIVYNGISPNGKNPAFIIEYIDLIPETKGNTVHIFDRWENLVWHGSNYDNTSVVFTGVSDGGSDLPSGVYYYKINFSSGRKTETGFISLRRQ